MALRVGLVLLIMSLAMVAESSFSFDDAVARFDLDSMASHRISGGSSCNGQVGDCIDEDEEAMMGSEAARRTLAERRYISYGALKKNGFQPCPIRGQSYYECNPRGRANPYTRGCSVITRCHRANY